MLLLVRKATSAGLCRTTNFKQSENIWINKQTINSFLRWYINFSNAISYKLSKGKYNYWRLIGCWMLEIPFMQNLLLHFAIHKNVYMTTHRNDDKGTKPFHPNIAAYVDAKIQIFASEFCVSPYCITIAISSIHPNQPCLDASLPTRIFRDRILWDPLWGIEYPPLSNLSDRPHQPAVFIIVQGCTPGPVRPFPWIFGGIHTTPSSQGFSPATKKPGLVTFFLPNFWSPLLLSLSLAV